MKEPAGLYLHVPFCSAICPYCDFAVRRGDGAKASDFIGRLIAEVEGLVRGEWRPEATQLADAVSELATSPFDSIYFGGGTPSLVPPEDLARLFETLRASFELSPGTRIFLESNPEDVNPGALEAWRASGIDFLSLGVQALEPRALKFLGRAHDVADAERAVKEAKEAGLGTVSMDLIYGLPGQDQDSWRRQLELALTWPIDHLSLYELEIHGRTTFGKKVQRGELEPLAEDRRAALFLETHRRLQGAGFDAYEVSNFARSPEHRSRHNRKYWRHVPYLGLGPSAHSLAIGEQGAWRFWNERLEPAWRRLVEDTTSPAAGWERLPATALALEAAMLGLRTREGLDLDHVERLSGLDLMPANAQRLAQWQGRGWLHRQGRLLVPTFEGMARADRLAAELEISAP